MNHVVTMLSLIPMNDLGFSWTNESCVKPQVGFRNPNLTLSYIRPKLFTRIEISILIFTTRSWLKKCKNVHLVFFVEFHSSLILLVLALVEFVVGRLPSSPPSCEDLSSYLQGWFQTTTLFLPKSSSSRIK